MSADWFPAHPSLLLLTVAVVAVLFLPLAAHLKQFFVVFLTNSLILGTEFFPSARKPGNYVTLIFFKQEQRNM